MGRVRKVPARPLVITVLVAVAVGGGFGLYWFQPWKLWQDRTVEEALPPIGGNLRSSCGVVLLDAHHADRAADTGER